MESRVSKHEVKVSWFLRACAVGLLCLAAIVTAVATRCEPVGMEEVENVE